MGVSVLTESGTDELPKDRTPYDLRHTFVTHSLQVERQEIGFVSKQLGHDKVTTTWDYYYHWLPENMMTNRDADKWHRTTSGATTGSSGETDEEADSETPMPQGEEWSRREDLNLRPADYELCSEPTEGTQEDPPTTEIKDLDNK